MFDFKIDKINNFQILDVNTLEPVMEMDNVTIESEIEPSSLSKETLSLTHEASFECELTDYSTLFGYATDYYNKPLDIEFYSPIMIQARWHKKHRINKKWLKRYGMKKDFILVKAKASEVAFDTERENPYEIECNMGIENMQYVFRLDQLRRNLKIEW
jgi:hypothetical protein